MHKDSTANDTARAAHSTLAHRPFSLSFPFRPLRYARGRHLAIRNGGVVFAT